MNEMYNALTKAKNKGILWPKIKLGNYIFTLSKYPNTVYVKSKTTKAYLGKIVNDVFFPTLTDAMAEIKEIISQPLSEALKIHGQRTGTCGICGRTLFNGLSIRAMIGPICADNYGISQEEVAEANDPTPVELSIMDL